MTEPIRSSRGPGSKISAKERKRRAMRDERQENADMWELDALKKQDERRYREGKAPWYTEAQWEAMLRAKDPEVHKVIRAGQRQPRTWDEINSTFGGGRDTKPLTR